MRAVGLLGDHQADEMPASHRDLVENSIGAATVSGTATRCHSRMSCSRCAALPAQRGAARPMVSVLAAAVCRTAASFTVDDVVYAIWSTGHEPPAQSHPQPVWIL